jgi:hypothetical protein
MKTRMAPVATPSIESGSVICMKRRQGLAPRMSAESSSRRSTPCSTEAIDSTMKRTIKWTNAAIPAEEPFSSASGRAVRPSQSTRTRFTSPRRASSTWKP